MTAGFYRPKMRYRPEHRLKMRNKKYTAAALLVPIFLTILASYLMWDERVVTQKHRTGILSSLLDKDSANFRNELIRGSVICGEVDSLNSDGRRTSYRRYISTVSAQVIEGDGQSTLANIDKSSEDVLEEFDWKLHERMAAVKARESQQKLGIYSEPPVNVPDEVTIYAWRFNRLWKKHCDSTQIKK